MNQIYIEEKTFNHIDFTEKAWPEGNYENCIFTSCNFSNTDLSRIIFCECKFTACNLSMAKLSQTAFRDITFKDCKLLGLHFDHCNQFITGLNFDNCIINISSFYKLKLKKTIFSNSTFAETDFAEADLTGSVFSNCDLGKTIFENSILEKADFRTSYNYSINPEVNRIKKAKFSTAGIAGLLCKYDIEIE
jgi:fluoroquinolone resistance protein